MLTRLKMLRQLKGIKLKELSQAVGVSASFLSRIESGKLKGSRETRVKISEALDVPEKKLFDAK